MDTLAIIKRIEIRLTELGMSKADFYKNSGISSASYSQWNTGMYNPSPKKLKSAAECLGLSYDYLCYGSNEEKEKAPADSDRRLPEKPTQNIIRIAGRDGSYRERTVTDEQLALFAAMFDQLPDVPDDL